MSDTPNNGDEGFIYKTKNRPVIIEASDVPVPGDEVLISPSPDGKFITHGTSPTPKVGDEGLIVQTENRPVYISGGVEGCNPDNLGYWGWKKAGIDGLFPGTQINTLTMIWSSAEFKAIKFDIYFIGYCKITAFGQVVLEMLSPTDENGYAVPFHLDQCYESDNPCGARAVRLELRIAGIMTFATISGNVEVLIGRNGSVDPTSEVVLL